MGYAIALLAGIILLIGSIVIFRQTVNFIKKGTRATATVIKFDEVSGGDGTSYTPIFKFTTTTNQEIIFTYHSAVSRTSFKIGEKVAVVYNSADPTSVKVLTYFGTFVPVILFTAVSICLIVIGGGYFFCQQYLK